MTSGIPPEPARSAGCAPSKPAGEDDSQATGLPFFHTWRSVYLFVLGSFILWIVLLSLLSALFR